LFKYHFSIFGSARPWGTLIGPLYTLWGQSGTLLRNWILYLGPSGSLLGLLGKLLGPSCLFLTPSGTFLGLIGDPQGRKPMADFDTHVGVRTLHSWGRTITIHNLHKQTNILASCQYMQCIPICLVQNIQ
jgi:hypothetical protein